MVSIHDSTHIDMYLADKRQNVDAILNILDSISPDPLPS